MNLKLILIQFNISEDKTQERRQDVHVEKSPEVYEDKLEEQNSNKRS